MRGFLVVVCAVSACSGPVGSDGLPPPGSSSGSVSGASSSRQSTEVQQRLEPGSRLRVVTLHADDGAVERAGFHDTELDEVCMFVRLTAGGIACAPVAGAADAYGVLTPSMVVTNAAVSTYADDACTERIVGRISSNTLDAPHWVGTVELSQAFAVTLTRLNRIGAAIPPGTTAWSMSGTTACTPTVLANGGFHIGEEFPLSGLVHATVSRD